MGGLALSPTTDRAAWLAARKRGVGASEAAAVLGLNPYCSPLEVYLRKTGELPDVAENAAMRWGTKLEEAIAQAYTEETGEPVEAQPLVRSDEWPWMFATVDRLSAGGRVVEIKNVGARMAEQWGDPGTDDVPVPYLLQVNHQLAVTGRRFADLAVLIGGSDFRIYPLERNNRLIDAMVAAERAFWERVERRQPPEPDWGHASTPALISALYAPTGPQVELPEAALAHLLAYQRAGDEEKAAHDAKEMAKARIMLAMKDATCAVFPDGTKVRRCLVRRKEYVVPAGEYTRFSVHKPRGR